jgi:integrase
MRRGELLGLRWSDVHLDGTTLHVRQTLIALKQGLRIKDPKTKSSRRPVGIPREVTDALREHQCDQNERCDKLGALWQENDLVFASEVGTPINPRNLPRDYDRLVTLAGIPRIRIHDLRHTYTTLALEHGANLLAVSKQLGHAKTSTTTDVYGHVSERMQQQVTDTIRAALFAPVRSPPVRFPAVGEI